MADINSFNSGDSSSSFNKYPVSGNNNIQSTPKVNSGDGSAEYSHGWRRMPRPFGMNVRVPQAPVIGVRTQEVIKRAISDLVLAPVQQVANYLKNNENVFNGNVSAEIKSLERQQQLTVELLQEADDIVMSSVPNFMMDM